MVQGMEDIDLHRHTKDHHIVRLGFHKFHHRSGFLEKRIHSLDRSSPIQERILYICTHLARHGSSNIHLYSHSFLCLQSRRLGHMYMFPGCCSRVT